MNDYSNILLSICIMYVDGVSGISKICDERDEQNKYTSNLLFFRSSNKVRESS